MMTREEMMQIASMVAEMMQAANKRTGGKRTGAPERVQYTKANGTVIECTPAEKAHYERQKAAAAEKRAAMTPEERAAEQERIEHWRKVVADGKAVDELVCRKLEAKLGVPAGSIAKSSITRDEACALGWKGTRKQLKDLKAAIRAEVSAQ